MTGPDTPDHPADLRPLLRLEVARLRSVQVRRRFDTVVHVGRLAGERRSCPVPTGDPCLDAGTRADLIVGLLEAVPEDQTTGAWITREGRPWLGDEDLAWLAAGIRAYGVLGREPTGFWTVTRWGWLDVRTGESRTWKRLRV